MSWLIENREWVFSGIGVSAVIFIISFFKKSSGSRQVQKSGASSINYQARGDINIGQNNDK